MTKYIFNQKFVSFFFHFLLIFRDLNFIWISLLFPSFFPLFAHIRNCYLPSSLYSFIFRYSSLCQEFFSSFIPLIKYVSAGNYFRIGAILNSCRIAKKKTSRGKKKKPTQNKPWTLLIFYTQRKKVGTGKNNYLNSLFWKVTNVGGKKSLLLSLQNQRNFRMTIHFTKLFFHYLNQVRTKCSILDKTHVSHCSSVWWLGNWYRLYYDLYLNRCREVNKMVGHLSGNWYSIFCIRMLEFGWCVKTLLL